MPKMLTNARVSNSDTPFLCEKSKSNKKEGKKNKAPLAALAPERYASSTGGRSKEPYENRHTNSKSLQKHAAFFQQSSSDRLNKQMLRMRKKLEGKIKPSRQNTQTSEYFVQKKLCEAICLSGEFMRNLSDHVRARRAASQAYRLEPIQERMRQTRILRPLQLLFFQPLLMLREMGQFCIQKQAPEASLVLETPSFTAAEAVPIPDDYVRARQQEEEAFLKRVKRGDDLTAFTADDLLFFSRTRTSDPSVSGPFVEFDNLFAKIAQPGGGKVVAVWELANTLRQCFLNANPLLKDEMLKRITFLETSWAENNTKFKATRERAINRFIESEKVNKPVFEMDPSIERRFDKYEVGSVDDARLIVFSSLLHNQITGEPINTRNLAKLSAETICYKLHQEILSGKEYADALENVQKKHAQRYKLNIHDLPESKLISPKIFDGFFSKQALTFIKSGALNQRTGYCFASAAAMNFIMLSGDVTSLQQADSLAKKLESIGSLPSTDARKALQTISTINLDVQAQPNIFTKKQFDVSIDDLLSQAEAGKSFVTIFGNSDANGDFFAYHAINISAVKASVPEGRIFVIFDANIGYFKAFSRLEASDLLRKIVDHETGSGAPIRLGYYEVNNANLAAAKGRLNLAVPDLIYLPIANLRDKMNFNNGWGVLARLNSFSNSPDTPLFSAGLIRGDQAFDFEPFSPTHNKVTSPLKLDVTNPFHSLSPVPMDVDENLHFRSSSPVPMDVDEDLHSLLQRSINDLNINNNNNRQSGTEQENLIKIAETYLTLEQKIEAKVSADRVNRALKRVNKKISDFVRQKLSSFSDWEVISNGKTILEKGYVKLRSKANQVVTKTISLDKPIILEIQRVRENINAQLKPLLPQSKTSTKILSGFSKLMSIYRAFLLSSAMQDYEQMSKVHQAELWLNVVDLSVDGIAMICATINKVLKMLGTPLSSAAIASRVSNVASIGVSVVVNGAEVGLASYSLHISETPLQRKVAGIRLGFALAQVALSLLSIAFPPAALLIAAAQFALSALENYIVEGFHDDLAKEAATFAFQYFQEDIKEIADIIQNARIEHSFEEDGTVIYYVHSKQPFKRLIFEDGLFRAERNGKPFGMEFLKRFAQKAREPYYHFDTPQFPNQEALKTNHRYPPFQYTYYTRQIQDYSLAQCQQPTLFDQTIETPLHQNASLIHVVLDGAHSIAYGIQKPVELGSPLARAQLPNNAPNLHKQDECGKQDRKKRWTVSERGAVLNREPSSCRHIYNQYENEYYMSGRRAYRRAKNTHLYYVPSVAMVKETRTRVILGADIKQSMLLSCPILLAFDEEKNRYLTPEESSVGLKNAYPNARLNKPFPRQRAACQPEAPDPYSTDMEWKHYDIDLNMPKDLILNLQHGASISVNKYTPSTKQEPSFLMITSIPIPEEENKSIPESRFLLKDVKIHQESDTVIQILINGGCMNAGAEVKIDRKNLLSRDILLKTEKGFIFRLEEHKENKTPYFKPLILNANDYVYQNKEDLYTFVLSSLEGIIQDSSPSELLEQSMITVLDLKIANSKGEVDSSLHASAHVFKNNPFYPETKDFLVVNKVWKQEDEQAKWFTDFQSAILMDVQALERSGYSILPKHLQEKASAYDMLSVTYWLDESSRTLFVQYGEFPVNFEDAKPCPNNQPAKISTAEMSNNDFHELSCENNFSYLMDQGLSINLLDFTNITSLSDQNTNKTSELVGVGLLSGFDQELEPIKEETDAEWIANELNATTYDSITKTVAPGIINSSAFILTGNRGILFVSSLLQRQNAELIFVSEDGRYGIFCTKNEEEWKLYRVSVIQNSEKLEEIKDSIEREGYLKSEFIPKPKRMLKNVHINEAAPLIGRDGLTLSTKDGVGMLISFGHKEAYFLGASAKTFDAMNLQAKNPIHVKQAFIKLVMGIGSPVAKYVLMHQGKPRDKTAMDSNIPLVIMESETLTPLFIDLQSTGISHKVSVLGSLSIISENEESASSVLTTIFDEQTKQLIEVQNAHDPIHTQATRRLSVETFFRSGEEQAYLECKASSRDQELPFIPLLKELLIYPTASDSQGALILQSKQIEALEAITIPSDLNSEGTYFPRLRINNTAAARDYPTSKMMYASYSPESPQSAVINLLKPKKNPSDPAPHYLKILIPDAFAYNQEDLVWDLSEKVKSYENFNRPPCLHVAGRDFSLRQLLMYVMKIIPRAEAEKNAAPEHYPTV